MLVLLGVVTNYLFGIDNEVMNKLKSNIAKERLSAIEYLSVEGSTEAINILINHFSNETDNYLRLQILDAIVSHPYIVNLSTQARTVILSGLSDKNPYIRYTTIYKLANLPEFSSEVAHLAVNDDNISVKMAACRTLSLYKSTSAVEAIDKVLSDTKNDKKLRLYAVKCLSKIDLKEAKNKLEKYKSDPDIELRKMVGEILNTKRKKK